MKSFLRTPVLLWQEGRKCLRERKLLASVASLCILLDGVTTFFLLTRPGAVFIEGNPFAARAMEVVSFPVYIFLGHILTLLLVVPVSLSRPKDWWGRILWMGAWATILGKLLVGTLNILLYWSVL